MNCNAPATRERQELAFQLLRQEALEAHREGDGLRMNLLCKTAFDGIDSLLKSGDLRLSLKEMFWAFSFQFHWLLDNFTGHLAIETFKKVATLNDKDKHLAAFLACQQYMISEPLSGVHPAFEMLNSLPLDALQDSPDPLLEESELLADLAELAWFRSIGNNEWRPLLDSWSKHRTGWISELARNILCRLEWQTRLVVSCPAHPLIDEDALPKLRAGSELADLWLLHLHGRRESVVRRVQELSPTLPNDTYRWRIVSDFWHFDRRPGMQDGDEQQGRWIARRRSQTAASSLLQFHDRRETRLVEILGDLFRENVPSNASKRHEAMQLAMLHELAALRLWDYGMWREATKAQSTVWLESARWTTKTPDYVVSGLMLGIRASELPAASKDALIRSSIEHLEFATHACLLDLSRQLLATYAAQKYDALRLIDEIVDLFPEETWIDLARWTVVTAEEMNEERLRGQSIGPAGFWRKLLPSVQPDSQIWSILIDEARVMASSQFCWEGETGDFLHCIVKYGPIAMARDICDTVLKAKPTENIFSLYRAIFLSKAEDSRAELNKDYTAKLPLAAPSREERMLLAERLDMNASVEAGLGKEIFSRKLAERLGLMVSASEPRATVPHERLGLHKVKSWSETDRELFMQIIETIENPRLSAEHLPELLSTLQLFLVNGLDEFFAQARPYVKKWVRTHRTLQGLPDETNPFARIHNVRNGDAFIQEQLGWIVYQYVARLGLDAKDLLDDLSEAVLRLQWQRPIGILSQCIVVLSAKLPCSETSVAMLRIRRMVDYLRALLPWDQRARSCLADVFSFFACFVGPHRDELLDWNSPQGEIISLQLVDILRLVAPESATSPDVRLRLTLARVLVFLSQWYTVPRDLAAIFEQLSCDNRARVRAAAIMD